MAGEVVHHDDVAWLERRDGRLAAVGKEQLAIDRAVDHQRGGQTLNYLPRVWLAPKKIRELRRLVRHRAQPVGRRQGVLIELAHRLISRIENRSKGLAACMLQRGKPKNVVVAAVANRWVRWRRHELRREATC